jgi:cytochrome c
MTTLFLTYATGIHHQSYVKFNQLDLTHIKGLTYRVQEQGVGGNIELHADSIGGPIISTLAIRPGKADDPKNGWKEVTAPLQEKISGVHDVYFVFTNRAEQKQNLFNIDWIYFARTN